VYSLVVFYFVFFGVYCNVYLLYRLLHSDSSQVIG